MTQQALPIADLAVTGSGFPNQWLNAHTNTPVALYSAIDEGIDEDTQGANDDVVLPTGAVAGDHIFVVKLSAVDEPGDKFGWRIEWMQKWLNGAGGDGTTQIDVELRQGYVNESSQGMLIDTSDNIGSINLQTATIHKEVWVVVEAARDSHNGAGPTTLGTHAITNYADLSLRYISHIPVGQAIPDGSYISSVEMSFARSATNFSAARRFPVSPISSEVFTIGSVNGSPVVQIINPSSSPVKLMIYELWIWGGGADGHTGLGRQWLNAARVTEDPWGPGTGATVKFGNSIHLKTDDTSTIWGIVKAFDFWNAQYHGPDAPNAEGWLEMEDPARWGIACQWMLRPEGGNKNQPTWLRHPDSFPLCLMPGQAFESLWMDNGTGGSTRLGVVFDQVLLD